MSFDPEDPSWKGINPYDLGQLHTVLSELDRQSRIHDAFEDARWLRRTFSDGDPNSEASRRAEDAARTIEQDALGISPPDPIVNPYDLGSIYTGFARIEAYEAVFKQLRTASEYLSMIPGSMPRPEARMIAFEIEKSAIELADQLKRLNERD